MLVAETCLLLAMRSHLGTKLEEWRSNVNKSLTTKVPGPITVNIELDSQIPAIASDTYVAIVPSGAEPGPRHRSSGGVWDMVYKVRVDVYQRMAEVARDRNRDIFIDRLGALNGVLDAVIRYVNMNYELTNTTAAALILDTPAAGGNYPEAFRTFTPDAHARTVFKDPYDAADMQTAIGNPVIALARGVVFSGARFMKEAL